MPYFTKIGDVNRPWSHPSGLITEPRFVTGIVSCAAPHAVDTGDAVLASGPGVATVGVAMAAVDKSAPTPFGKARENLALQVMGVASVSASNQADSRRHQGGFAVGSFGEPPRFASG